MSIENPTTNEEWAIHNRLLDEELEANPDEGTCEYCRAPNVHCQCDAIYDRAHDK